MSYILINRYHISKPPEPERGGQKNGLHGAKSRVADPLLQNADPDLDLDPLFLRNMDPDPFLPEKF